MPIICHFIYYRLLMCSGRITRSSLVLIVAFVADNKLCPGVVLVFRFYSTTCVCVCGCGNIAKHMLLLHALLPPVIHSVHLRWQQRQLRP